MLLKYTECKASAYQQMNRIRRDTQYLCTLSEIYNGLPQIQKYAVAIDTLDYMFDDTGFSGHWHFSDYAQITMGVLQDLFSTVIATIDDIEAIRVVYAVERAIEKSRWLVKDKQEVDLDDATVSALDEIQSAYRSLRPQFITVMKQWFEAQS